MYPEVHKVSKRLRAPEEVEEVDREGSQTKREDKETAKYPIGATSDHGRRPGYLLKTVSHPCGLKMTDRSLGRCPSVLGMIARLCRVQVCTRPSTGSLWPVAFQTGLVPLKESRASRVQACTRPSTRSLVGPRLVTSMS